MNKKQFEKMLNAAYEHLERNGPIFMLDMADARNAVGSIIVGLSASIADADTPQDVQKLVSIAAASLDGICSGMSEHIAKTVPLVKASGVNRKKVKAVAEATEKWLGDVGPESQVNISAASFAALMSGSMFAVGFLATRDPVTAKGILACIKSIVARFVPALEDEIKKAVGNL